MFSRPRSDGVTNVSVFIPTRAARRELAGPLPSGALMLVVLPQWSLMVSFV